MSSRIRPASTSIRSCQRRARSLRVATLITGTFFRFVARRLDTRPEDYERLDALDIICESTLIVTGTFVQGAEPPADHLGCWPVGTWTINTEVDRLGCDPQPSLSEDHVYNVVFDEEASSINVSFANDPEDERVNLKISTAGDSLCHGGMEHFGTDYAVWSLLPVLQLDGTLQGIGTYSVYNEDPF